MTDDDMCLRRPATTHNTWATRVVTCEAGSEKNVRMSAYGEVFSVHSPSRSWQLPLSGRETARKEKHRRSAQDYEWMLNSGEFDNGWDLVALTFRTSLLILAEVEDRDIVDVITDPHHSLCCQPWECHSYHWGSQDEELHHVELSFRVQDEDDEKYVGQLKTNLNVFELLDPMCYLVLFAPLSECEVLLYLELVEGQQEHLLMICNQVVDTMSCSFIGINACHEDPSFIS